MRVYDNQSTKTVKGKNTMARKANVLLVEDDSGVRTALGNALVAENYGVVAASSAKEALKQFQDNPVDVALLDLSLGQENGWYIFQQLRDLQPRLSIIVMSGWSQLFGHARAHTAAAILEKPLDLPALFQTLDRITAGPRVPRNIHGNGITERAE